MPPVQNDYRIAALNSFFSFSKREKKYMHKFTQNRTPTQPNETQREWEKKWAEEEKIENAVNETWYGYKLNYG